MDAIDKLGLLADLENQHCHLNHGPGIDLTKIKAVDYIVQPIGKTKVEDESKDIKHLVIPICEECVEGLVDNNWVLLYCLNCDKSQWVYKPFAKMKYNHNIIWVGNCPKCSNDPCEKVYFT